MADGILTSHTLDQSFESLITINRLKIIYMLSNHYNSLGLEICQNKTWVTTHNYDDLSNIKGNIKGMSWFQLSVSIIKQSNTCQRV